MRSQSALMRIAHAVSILFHPLVLILMLTVLISGQVRSSAILGVRDALILALCLLPGFLYLLVAKRQNQSVRYHRVVLPLMLVGLVISFFIYRSIGTPNIALRGLAIALVVGMGATVIDRFWNMSFHASIAMSCAALLIPFSLYQMVVIAIIGIVVGIARLPIKQHTIPQVVAGWLYGFGATAVLVILFV
jgi:membrane-associated phospholipid phosphatase